MTDTAPRFIHDPYSFTGWADASAISPRSEGPDSLMARSPSTSTTTTTASTSTSQSGIGNRSSASSSSSASLSISAFDYPSLSTSIHTSAPPPLAPATTSPTGSDPQPCSPTAYYGPAFYTIPIIDQIALNAIESPPPRFESPQQALQRQFHSYPKRHTRPPALCKLFPETNSHLEHEMEEDNDDEEFVGCVSPTVFDVESSSALESSLVAPSSGRLSPMSSHTAMSSSSLTLTPSSSVTSPKRMCPQPFPFHRPDLYPYAHGCLCNHYSKWKRLRMRKGVNHMKCTKCNALWYSSPGDAVPPPPPQMSIAT